MLLSIVARIRSLMLQQAPTEGDDSQPHLLLQQQKAQLQQLQQQVQHLTTENEFLRFLQTGGPSPPVVRPASDAPQSGASHQVGDGRVRDAPRGSAVEALEKVGHRYPRLRAVAMFIAIPLLCLIGLCFLCGHFLAVFEMPAEIKANQGAIRKRMELSKSFNVFAETAYWLERDSTTMGGSDAKDRYDLHYANVLKSVKLGVSQLSFHWMECAPDDFMDEMGMEVGEDRKPSKGSSEPTDKTKNDIDLQGSSKPTDKTKDKTDQQSPMEGNFGEDHQGSSNSKPTDKIKNDIDLQSPMEGNLGEDHQGSSKPTDKTKEKTDLQSPMEGNFGEDNQGSSNSKSTDKTKDDIDLQSPMEGNLGEDHQGSSKPTNKIKRKTDQQNPMEGNFREEHQGSSNSKPTNKINTDIELQSPMEGDFGKDHQGSSNSKPTDETKNDIDLQSPMEGNPGEDYQGSSKPTDKTKNDQGSSKPTKDEEQAEQQVSSIVSIAMLSPMAIYGKDFLESMSREDKESIYAQHAYHKEFITLQEVYYKEYGNSDKVDEAAWKDADGHSECSASTLGGAMFWFTVMTTIGYGNASVLTVEGRCLVYTAGFVSMLLFTAVMGQAGCVMVAVCDDYFKRSKYTRRLVSGWAASLFWLACYYLWNLVFGAIVIAYWKQRLGQELILRDAFWFSFASTTTIGFGDFHIRHAYVEWYDLFWIPLPILMGFVLLTNFALKFGEWMLETVGTKHLPNYDLEDILKQQRPSFHFRRRSQRELSNP